MLLLLLLQLGLALLCQTLLCFASTFHVELHFADALKPLVLTRTSRDLAASGPKLEKRERNAFN